jgi:hypothetical protein
VEKDKQKDMTKESQESQQENMAAAELLKEKDRQIAEYERRIEMMKFDSMLDEKLSASRARNKQAVRALMDMDKITLVEGRIIGAEEQISAIKAKDSYLFEGVSTGGGVNPSGAKEQVDMDALSDREYFRVRFNK